METGLSRGLSVAIASVCLQVGGGGFGGNAGCRYPSVYLCGKQVITFPDMIFK